MRTASLVALLAGAACLVAGFVHGADVGEKQMKLWKQVGSLSSSQQNSKLWRFRRIESEKCYSLVLS